MSKRPFESDFNGEQNGVCSFILGHVGIELHVFVSSCVVNATILAYAITCFVPLSLLEDCCFYRSWLSKRPFESDFNGE